jgi:hypothetical protein
VTEGTYLFFNLHKNIIQIKTILDFLFPDDVIISFVFLRLIFSSKLVFFKLGIYNILIYNFKIMFKRVLTYCYFLLCGNLGSDHGCDTTLVSKTVFGIFQECLVCLKIEK